MLQEGSEDAGAAVKGWELEVEGVNKREKERGAEGARGRKVPISNSGVLITTKLEAWATKTACALIPVTASGSGLAFRGSEAGIFRTCSR